MNRQDAFLKDKTPIKVYATNQDMVMYEYVAKNYDWSQTEVIEPTYQGKAQLWEEGTC